MITKDLIYDSIRENLSVHPMVLKSSNPNVGVDFTVAGTIGRIGNGIIIYSLLVDEFRVAIRPSYKVNNPVRISDFLRNGIVLTITGDYDEIK